MKAKLSAKQLPIRDSHQGERQTESEGDGKRYFMQMEMTREWLQQILASDKIDFKTKALKKRHRKALSNDKGINTRRGYYTH